MRFVVLSSGLIALAAGLALAPSAPIARAAPSVSALLSKEFQAGVDAYRLGKYDEARAHLDKARALDPKLPGPHRFLAAVASAQQRWTDCIAETRLALQLNPQSKEVAETRKLHDACRTGAGRPAYRDDLGNNAAISVTTNVTGASVRIGNLRYGSTPVAPRLIRPGPHELDIEKQGWKPAHVAIDALPGIVTDVEVVLQPAEAKPGPPPTPSSPPRVRPRSSPASSR